MASCSSLQRTLLSVACVLAVITAVCWAVAATSRSARSVTSADPQSVSAPGPRSVSSGGPRLYILDCGTIAPMDPNLFGLKPEEVNRDIGFVTPCYLIVHPKGTLIWDTGEVP